LFFSVNIILDWALGIGYWYSPVPSPGWRS